MVLLTCIAAILKSNEKVYCAKGITSLLPYKNAADINHV
jgi:hypothetical protein